MGYTELWSGPLGSISCSSRDPMTIKLDEKLEFRTQAHSGVRVDP